MTEALLELRRLADELKEWSEEVAQHQGGDDDGRDADQNISIGLSWAEEHVRERIDELEDDTF